MALVVSLYASRVSGSNFHPHNTFIHYCTQRCLIKWEKECLFTWCLDSGCGRHTPQWTPARISWTFDSQARTRGRTAERKMLKVRGLFPLFVMQSAMKCTFAPPLFPLWLTNIDLSCMPLSGEALRTAVKWNILVAPLQCTARCHMSSLTLLTPGLGLQRTTTAEQSWSYTRDQRSEQVLTWRAEISWRLLSSNV